MSNIDRIEQKLQIIVFSMLGFKYILYRALNFSPI